MLILNWDVGCWTILVEVASSEFSSFSNCNILPITVRAESVLVQERGLLNPSKTQFRWYISKLASRMSDDQTSLPHFKLTSMCTSSF